MTVVRRAFFMGGGHVEIRESRLPAVTSDLVRVEVEAAALCGSDRRLFWTGSPFVPGHEISGTVSEVGDLVPSSLVGQKGVVYIPVYCGHCRNCKQGFTNGHIHLHDLIGWQRHGGFATHVDVPVRCFVPIPEGITADVALLALDTLGTAAHSLRWARRVQGFSVDRMAILGAGPLGLGLIAAARELGFPSPEVHDPLAHRLELALGLGAGRLDPEAALGEVDLVVEASGADAARDLAQKLVRPGAVLLMLGESHQPYVIPATPRTRRTNLFSLRTFYFPLSEVAENWQLVMRVGQETFGAMVGTQGKLDDLPELFMEFDQGKVGKPVIYPNGRPITRAEPNHTDGGRAG